MKRAKGETSIGGLRGEQHAEARTPCDVRRYSLVCRLKNTGTSTWANGYQFSFGGGDQLNAPTCVDAPAAGPNAEVNIRVNMRALATGGTYRGEWQMRN